MGPETAAVMRVHASNFRTLGFTEEASLADLCDLARHRRVAVIDDLGSGVLARRSDGLAEVLRDEPAARESVAAGVDAVCFSADKLLGGPQAGIVAGRGEAIEHMRSHPLARAVRIDKLSLAALEATLRLHRDDQRSGRDVPVLQMLGTSQAELEARAERLRAGIAGAAADVAVIRAASRAGGGSLPLLELEGPVVAVTPNAIGPDDLHARMRAGEPPVVARVNEGAVLLDPRTITEVEVDFTVRAVRAALE